MVRSALQILGPRRQHLIVKRQVPSKGRAGIVGGCLEVPPPASPRSRRCRPVRPSLGEDAAAEFVRGVRVGGPGRPVRPSWGEAWGPFAGCLPGPWGHPPLNCVLALTLLCEQLQ